MSAVFSRILTNVLHLVSILMPPGVYFVHHLVSILWSYDINIIKMASAIAGI